MQHPTKAVVLIICLIIYGCVKEIPKPSFGPIDISSITHYSATATTSINEKEYKIVHKGFIWDISEIPLLNFSEGNSMDRGYTVNSSDSSYFSGDLHLKPGTKYNVKAYATISIDLYPNEKENVTFHSDPVSFTTLPAPSYDHEVRDIDNNLYQTIMIGPDIWMGADLITKHFSNGDDITNFRPYMNTILYSYETVLDNRNVCPTGWHVSSLSEWESMINYLDLNYTEWHKNLIVGEVSANENVVVNSWWVIKNDIPNSLTINYFPSYHDLNYFIGVASITSIKCIKNNGLKAIP